MQITPKLAVKDYAGALVVVLFGTALAGQAASYPLGSLLRPGPGFFPLVIGCLIALLGIAIAAEAWLTGSHPSLSETDDGLSPGQSPWRAVIAVTIGVLAFWFLIDRAGYLVASAALVVISALGQIRQSWWTVGVVAMIMAIGGSILFIWGLGLPFQTFGSR